MRKKIKNNRAISLIEVLISLAILGILMIPVSSIVNTSIKTNSNSDMKQQGMLIGQEILEQMEILENAEKYPNNVSLDELKLPSGRVIKKSETNTYDKLSYYEEAQVENNTYDVDIHMEKNPSFEYEEKHTQEPLDVDLTIEFEGYDNGNIHIKVNNKDYTVQTVEEDNNVRRIDFRVMKNLNNESSTISINEQDIEVKFSGNKIMVHFMEGFSLGKNELDIYVYNDLEDGLELYSKKSCSIREDIDVINRLGKLKFIDDVIDEDEISNRTINPVYDIRVKVSKDERVLFDGKTTKNLRVSD